MDCPVDDQCIYILVSAIERLKEGRGFAGYREPTIGQDSLDVLGTVLDVLKLFNLVRSYARECADFLTLARPVAGAPFTNKSFTDILVASSNLSASPLKSLKILLRQMPQRVPKWAT